MCHIIGVAMVTSEYFDSGLAFLGSWFRGLSYDTKLSMPLGGADRNKALSVLGSWTLRGK